MFQDGPPQFEKTIQDNYLSFDKQLGAFCWHPFDSPQLFQKQIADALEGVWQQRHSIAQLALLDKDHAQAISVLREILFAEELQLDASAKARVAMKLCLLMKPNDPNRKELIKSVEPDIAALLNWCVGYQLWLKDPRSPQTELPKSEDLIPELKALCKLDRWRSEGDDASASQQQIWDEVRAWQDSWGTERDPLILSYANWIASGSNVRYPEALKRAFDWASKAMEPVLVGWLKFSSAELSFASNKPKEALSHLDDLISLSRRIGWHRGELIAQRRLCAHYDQTDEADKAYDALEQVDALQDALFELEVREGEWNKLNGLVSEISDLNHRKQQKLERGRRAHNVREELTQFAHIISHDLREPLRTITAFSDILERKYGNGQGESFGQYLNFIKSGVEGIDHLLNDLISYVTLDSKKIKNQSVDLNHCLKQVIRSNAETMRKYHVQIVQDDLPLVTGDTALMKQLMSNLIHFSVSNANEDQELQLSFSHETVNGLHQIIMKDNGKFIEPSQRELLFSYLLGSPENMEGGRVGMALCKKILSIHGGNIRIESDEKGNTYLMEIPVGDN